MKMNCKEPAVCVGRKLPVALLRLILRDVLQTLRNINRFTLFEKYLVNLVAQLMNKMSSFTNNKMHTAQQ